MVRQPTSQELAEAVSRIKRERDEYLDLLQQVAAAVVDTAPDGLTVAYLSAQTVAAIRRHVHI